MFLELLLISKEKLGKIPLLFFYSYPANQTTGGSCFASPCSCPLWELILDPGSLDPKVGCVPLSPPCAKSTHILFYTGQWRDASCQTQCSSGYLSNSGYLLVLLTPETFWDRHQTRLASRVCDVWLRTETDAILSFFSHVPWILLASIQIPWSPSARSTASVTYRSRKSLPRWFEFY